MRDRLELFGGRLEILSAPGQGTLVSADSAPPGGAMTRRVRVLVADDHTIVRQGLVSLLAESGECEVVAEAADGLEAVEKALATRPDVAILDLSMPRLSGLEAVRRIHEALPQTRVLVLTVHEEEEYVLPLVRAGASGYLIKDSAVAELLAAVRALHAGQGYFGPQAARVLAEQYRHPERTAGRSLRHPLPARARGLPPRGRRPHHQGDRPRPRHQRQDRRQPPLPPDGEARTSTTPPSWSATPPGGGCSTDRLSLSPGERAGERGSDQL